MASPSQLHPSIQAFLASFADTPIPPVSSMDIATMRQVFDQPIPVKPITVAECRDLEVPGAEGNLPARLYLPGEKSSRVTVFFHGGGFVMGTLETHDNLCRNLCRELNSAIIAVDYRLAPEHPFPAAPEDCYAATQWVAANRAEFASPDAKLFLAGDSAGACLCAAVSLLSRERQGVDIDSQLLFYPTVSPPQDTESYRSLGDGSYFLSREMMDFNWSSYLNSPGDNQPSSVAAPLLAKDLKGLPPTHIVLAEFDPLRDEGTAFTERLQAAGNKVELQIAKGMIHGFMSLPGVDREVTSILQLITQRFSTS